MTSALDKGEWSASCQYIKYKLKMIVNLFSLDQQSLRRAPAILRFDYPHCKEDGEVAASAGKIVNTSLW
jgi:hypothetical protein